MIKMDMIKADMIKTGIIKTYIMNISQLEKEAAFNEAADKISPYRRQKAALLKHQKDKKRSVCAALALDAALKGYGLEERSMEYDLGEQGKPVFRYYPGLHFSISHSGDYALCSIGEQEIGNDIEWIRAGKERVAERFFAKEELEWMRKADSLSEREERMFRLWTMKESFLKVTGLGMSLPLNDFAVLIEEDNTLHIRQQVNDKTYFMKEYAMPAHFEEKTGYSISVCSENPDFAPELEVVLF